ncbi:hypothetical protein D3C80_1083870 [compost metagenome]
MERFQFQLQQINIFLSETLTHLLLMAENLLLIMEMLEHYTSGRMYRCQKKQMEAIPIDTAVQIMQYSHCLEQQELQLEARLLRDILV